MLTVGIEPTVSPLSGECFTVKLRQHLERKTGITGDRTRVSELTVRCSATKPYSRMESEGQDSNLQPHGPKPCALRKLSYPQINDPDGT